MPRLGKNSNMDARSLQQVINRKQARVGDKLSVLKSELTRNPISEIAERKPVIIVGSAVVLGVLGTLTWRALSSDRSRRVNHEELAEEVTRLLHERYADRAVPPTRGEVAKTIQNIEPSTAPATRMRGGTRMGVFIGSFLGSIAKSVVREVLSSLLASITEKTGTRHPESSR